LVYRVQRDQGGKADAAIPKVMDEIAFMVTSLVSNITQESGAIILQSRAGLPQITQKPKKK
jgi:hypothetical protein